MKIIYNNNIPFKGYLCLNFFGLILFVRRKEVVDFWTGERYRVDPDITAETMNHELIHSAQYKETLFIGFLLWYGIEYLIRIIAECVMSIVGKTASGNKDGILHRAYRNLSMEQEAYGYEDLSFYLEYRPHYAWLKYLFKRTYRG